jgi:pantoate--beta-alanine ligase
VYLGARRRDVGIVLNQALRKAELQYKNGMRLRNDVLWPAFDHGDQTLLSQDQLEPNKRALFEVDYISLADPDTMEEIDQIDDTRGAILSGAVKMLPVEEPQEGEELGQLDAEGRQVPVRLIDNIVLDPMR